MVAIKVTQNIIDKNSGLNLVLDSIYSLPKIPKVWNGWEGYNYIHATTHQADGWRQLIHTAYNPFTHKEKLNKIVPVKDENDNSIILHYTYKIVELNEEQQAQYLSNIEDAQDEAEEELHEAEGFNLIRRTRKRLRRKVKKELADPTNENGLSINQANKLRRWFSQIFWLLRQGDWDLANEDILAESFPVPNNQKLIDEIEWLKDKISNYISNDFNKQ